MPIAAVVADANVLLSAVIGKAALRVFAESELEIHATCFNASEVEEYLPTMAEKYELSPELVQLAWKLLPIQFHPESAYESQIAQAQLDLADRDPDDAHPLALARTLEIPLWTNDRDLKGLGVTCYTTAELLKKWSV